MKKFALLVGLSTLGFSSGLVHAAEEALQPDEAAEPGAEPEPAAAAEPGAEPAAEAAAEPATDDKTSSSEKGPDFGHGGQFGLRLDAVWGYRMVFRYPESPFCAEPDTAKTVDDQQAFCGHSGPWGMNAALSYAVLDGIEPYLWGRFGLEGEPQTNTEPVVIIGAGVRIYTMSDSDFKILVEPAVGLEFEGAAENELYDPSEPGGWEPPDRYDYEPEYKRDFVFHVAAGPHWDFSEYFGAYVTGGLTVGVLRYISASMELQFGVQGRLP